METYKVKTCTIDNCTITYRAFENIQYCQKPVDDIQKMNIYIPEEYYSNKKINGYNLHSAPIFMPNTVGGYMPGPVDEAGLDRHGHANSIFEALKHGYVVASAGVRGRTSGKVSTEFFEGTKSDYIGKATGKKVGRAPAFIVDMKAAIRYLREFQNKFGFNTNRIITNGTSAGGALSALTGASGNSLDYESYLEEIGAYHQRDDIYAASCYCPIHNLENADSAYEWQFYKETHWYRTAHKKTKHGIERVPVDGEMSDNQIQISKELKNLFPDYVNSLNLGYSLDAYGNGSFKEYVKKQIIQSAQKELDTRLTSNHLKWLMTKGSEVDNQKALKIESGQVIDVDFDAYNASITRMKATPAFDDLGLKSPENEEFGDEEIDGKHFTKYSYEHSEGNGQLANSNVIKMMNPIEYIGKADTCKYWRIRHGSFDRDTSLAIPTILSLMLEKNECNVDFFLPWGLPHSGDYDLDELFDWIDEIV